MEIEKPPLSLYTEKLTFVVEGLCQASLALTAITTARILADTNRDGQVNDADAESKDIWTPDRGALLLPNIGDTDQRCSKLVAPNVTDDTIDDCNDATDNVLRNSKFLVPLRSAPLTGLDEGSRGYFNIIDGVAAGKVRIFVKLDDHDEWEYVSSSSVFTANQISSGLELGIDARDVRRPNIWDGRVTVNFAVVSGESFSTDSVALRVAPVLPHSPSRPARGARLHNFRERAGVIAEAVQY
jgi:protein-arginine deiminase